MEVTPSKWYAVTTDSSCTVTDANGKVLCTAEAGEQKYFLATTPSITLSDEGATVTKATFNCALAVLGLLGGGSDKLPAGYVRAEFLEGTGTQWVETDFYPNGETEFEIKYLIKELVYNMHFFGAREKWLINQYQLTANPDGMFIRYGTNNVFFGIWSAPELNVPTIASLLGNKAVIGSREGVIKRSAFECPSPLFVFGASQMGEIHENKFHGEIYYFKLMSSGTLVLDFVPALDTTGRPCMFDLVTRKPFYNSGTGQFIVGIKDAAQLRTVLRKLPDLTGQDMGTLTLSIPAEANTPEMQELLDTTETQKNWELTIQERAAAVATYSLRRVRKLVWVRKVQDENGRYVDASGLRWQTEWCSAIYSPHGNDPTLHGYEPFDSVEQAVEAWSLMPYEYPEEELLTETE